MNIYILFHTIISGIFLSPVSEVAWQLNWHDLLPWCFPKVYLPEQKTPIAKEEIYTSYTWLNDSLDTSMIGVFSQKALQAKNQ